MHKSWSFIFLLVSTTLFAQTRLDKPEVYLGITGGAIGSMVMFKPTVNQSYLLGYTGGIVFRYIDEKNVGMQAELNFSQRGWKESNGQYSKQLNYIELPFLTHIYMGKTNRFFINLGPKISYLVSEKALVNLVSTEPQQTTAIQNPFDYGLCAGFGILFNIKGNVIQFDTRAYYGLSDIYSNAKKDYFDASNNVNVTANIAWLIQLK